MRQLKVETDRGLEAVGDLRKKRARRLVEAICEGARYLPDDQKALMSDIFERGEPIARVATRRAQCPRGLSRRVHRIAARVLDPRFRYVAEHQSHWRPTRRQVASACIIEGLSIREAAQKLQLSQYTVRKHKEAIDALCEEVTRPGARR